MLYKTADDDKLYYTYTNKKGETVTKKRTQASTKMRETDDARTLISDMHHPVEEAYASYANSMKALANSARKASLTTEDTPYSPSAARIYAKEVRSLDTKLNTALLNAPRERKAQMAARVEVDGIKKDNPYMTTGEVKKLSQRALTKYRARFGAQRTPIKIEDKEWEAIQSGAITKSKLRQIINNTDADSLKERATPRTRTVLTPGKVAKIEAMKASGLYTNADIAKAIGVSATTVANYGKKKE